MVRGSLCAVSVCWGGFTTARENLSTAVSCSELASRDAHKMLQNVNEFRIPNWGTSLCLCWNDADFHFNMSRNTGGAYIESNLMSDNEVFSAPCITIIITVLSAIVIHSSLYADTVLTPDIRLSLPTLHFWTVSCFPTKINTLVFITKRVVLEYVIQCDLWMNSNSCLAHLLVRCCCFYFYCCCCCCWWWWW